MLTLPKILLRSFAARIGWRQPLEIARLVHGNPGEAYKSITADAYVAREAPRNYIFTDNASSINVTNTSDLVLSDNYPVSSGYKIVTEEGFAYVVEFQEATFTILNVSDAENITFVNSEELTHGEVNNLYDILHYTGNWFIALGTSYLIGPPGDPDVNVWAIDVTSKVSPSITRNSIVYGYGYRTSGWIQGDVLYVAIAAVSGSVEDRVSKCALGSVPTVTQVDQLVSDTYDSGFAEITGSGDYIYISWHQNNIIRSYDTATLSVADTIAVTSPKGLVVDGDYLYVVCDTTNSVRVIDISDPTNLSEYSSLVDNTNLADASFICLSPQGDKTAYVACPGSDRVTAIDISNPADITVLDSLVDAVNLNNVSGIAAETSSILTVTADAIIEATLSKTVLADAIIDALRKTITADAYIDALRQTVTADAYIDPLGSKLLATMPVAYYPAEAYRTLYARMSVFDLDDGATTSQTVSAIMSIINRLTNPVTADAFIKLVASQAVTSDAFIDALRQTVTSDAYIRGTASKGITADAFIDALRKTVTSDAFVDALRQTVTADAYIRGTQSQAITADAYIRGTQSKAITSDAFIDALRKTITADAYIRGTASKGMTSDAFIDALRQTVTADAFIDAVRKTVTVDAFIKETVTTIVTSDAFIDSLRKTITVDAFIKAVKQKGIDADAIIKAVQQKTVTADAFIKRAFRHVVSNVHLFASMMFRRR